MTILRRTTKILISSDPNVALLSLVTLTVACGAGAYGAVYALYFTGPVGLTAEGFGVAASAAGLVGFLSTFLSGRLVDTIGPYPVAVAATALQAVALIAYLAADTLLTATLLLSAFASLSQFASTGRGSWIAVMVSPEKRSEARGYTFAMAQLGLAVGALGGALLASAATFQGLAEAIILDAALVALAVAMLVVLRRRVDTTARPPESRASGPGDAAGSPGTGAPFVHRAVVALLGGMLSVPALMTTIALPIWAVRVHRMDPFWIGVWSALATAIVVVIHTSFARAAASARRALRMCSAGAWLCAVGIVLVGCVSGASAVGIGLVTFAVLLLGVGSSATASATWSLSYSMAPPNRVGQNQALFNAALAIAGAVGTLAFTRVATSTSTAGWLAIAGAVVLCSVLLSATALPVLSRLPAQDR